MCVADSGLHVRVVLPFGHTLQVSFEGLFDHQREVCNHPVQGGVFAEQLVTDTLPRMVDR